EVARELIKHLYESWAALSRLCRNCEGGRRECLELGRTSARPRVSGDPAAKAKSWIPACAGMSGKRARANLALPTGALRTRPIERRGCREPVRHPNRNLGPADTPWRAAAVPPDPAPAVFKTNERVIGARR